MGRKVIRPCPRTQTSGNSRRRSSAVAPGAAQANAAIKSVTESVAVLAQSSQAAAASVVGSFQKMGAQIKETGEGIEAFKASISSIGSVLIAAFAVHEITEFADKMAETALQSVHTAETFGLTTQAVRSMRAEATLFGVPAEAMTTAMMRLDKAFQTAKEGGTQQAAAFKEVGISLQGSYTQTQLMNAALSGLAAMASGPAKVAAAMAMFGRNIQAIGPLLGLTKEQLSDAAGEMEKYGIASDTAAKDMTEAQKALAAANDLSTQKGLALADSFDQNKVAMQGLNSVLTDALAPTFKVIVDDVNNLVAAFTASYNKGGAAKVVMDDIVLSLRILGSLCVDVTNVVKTLFSVFPAGADEAKQKTDYFKDALVTLGQIFLVVQGLRRPSSAWSRSAFRRCPPRSRASGRCSTTLTTSAFSRWGPIGPRPRPACGRRRTRPLRPSSRIGPRSTPRARIEASPGSGALPALPTAGTGTTADDAEKAAKKEKAATLDLMATIDAVAQFDKEAEKSRTENLLEQIQVREAAELGAQDAAKQLAAERLASQKSTDAMLVATGRMSKVQQQQDLENADAQQIATEENTAEIIYQAKLKALNAELALGKDVNKQIETLQAQHEATMVQLAQKGARGNPAGDG